MNNKEYAGIVLQELTHTLSSIDEVQAEKFVQLIDEADEVFCAGAGRSGFQVKGFAMRLMHMGVASYVVGETCTPNIKEGGVLVQRKRRNKIACQPCRKSKGNGSTGSTHHHQS